MKFLFLEPKIVTTENLKKFWTFRKLKNDERRNLFCDFFSMETSEERHSRGLHDLLLRFRCLLVLLARLETKRRSFNADLFSTRFFPPLRRSFFSFSVSDRVSKSKFLFPFSFSSHERLPWFKYV